MKQLKLLCLLKDGKMFGYVNAWMYTIEWQKWDLPHSHTFIWRKEKMRPDSIDDIICAEFPNTEQDAQLCNSVEKHMFTRPAAVFNLDLLT